MIGDNLTELQKETVRVLIRAKPEIITGKDIANSIGLKPRSTGKDGADMRSVINALRTKGWPICATGDGYYYASSGEQLSKFITEFQGRINKQQVAVNGLKKAFDKLNVKVRPEIPVVLPVIQQDKLNSL